jgi:hypothetical protein
LILDFKEAINAELPKSVSVHTKQEEFELAELYQQYVILSSSDKGSTRQKNNKKPNKSLKEKHFLKEENDVHQEPQPGPSGITSK